MERGGERVIEGERVGRKRRKRKEEGWEVRRQAGVDGGRDGRRE